MNILTEKLPDYITVDNVKYAVNTDFRIWMEFDSMLHNRTLNLKDKIMMVFRLCFDLEKCRILPEDINSAMDGLCTFYICGKKPIKQGNIRKASQRVLDYSQDSGYIYSAFLTQYGIDLLSVPYMHWYAFCALMDGLEDSRHLKKIIGFRVCCPDDVKNKEKRNYLKRMKELYALPDTRSDKEKEGDMAEILSNI